MAPERVEIVLLMMGAPAPAQVREIEALRERHAVKVVEPRFPECKEALESARPGLIVVDGAQSPSHGRATARWMASASRFRTVPVLFLDVPDKDVARVEKDVPRAQLGAWVTLSSTGARMVKR